MVKNYFTTFDTYYDVSFIVNSCKDSGTFATPYILGTPAKYTLLSTSLYSSVRSNDSGVVAVIAIVLSLIGLMLLLVDIWVVRKWQRFVTVGGKGIKRQPSKLGVLECQLLFLLG